VEPGGISYVLNDQEDILVGNIYPNFLGGLSSDLTFKGFNLGVFLDYSYGATVFNFSDYVMKGTGTTVQSLPGRNEKHGGIAYYIEDASGEKIRWEHDQAAPPGARDGLVYHDGIIIDGVQEDLTDIDNPIYTENDVIVSASDYYYSNYVYWTGGQLLDGINSRYDNDYIKIREISLSYSFPKAVARKLQLQRLSAAVFGRNIGYLYRTMPNFDAEAATGTKTFRGGVVLPSTQSYGFQISLGL
jgi:iron complex outermembrane receptor protein